MFNQLRGEEMCWVTPRELEAPLGGNLGRVEKEHCDQNKPPPPM